MSAPAGQSLRVISYVVPATNARAAATGSNGEDRSHQCPHLSVQSGSFHAQLTARMAVATSFDAHRAFGGALSIFRGA